MPRMTYEATMAYGAAQYADALAALADVGLRGEFTQTGGMCAALMVSLEAGYYLLVTDYEDTLSWERCDHRGWWVGLYPSDESGLQGPIRWLDSEGSDVAEMVRLAVAVLRPGADAVGC